MTKVYTEKFTKRITPKVMFVNCGDGFGTRNVSDNARLNFISAGQGKRFGNRPFFFSNQIRNLIINDIICVYRNRVGYIGIAQVISLPMPITKAILGGEKVSNTMFSQGTNMFNESQDPGYEECLVEIKWLTNVHLNAHEGSGACYGMYAKPHAVCRLDNQSETRKCLQASFKLNFKDLIINYEDR